MKRYLFFLLLCSYAHAADKKDQEKRIQSLQKQIERQQQLMDEAKECAQDSREQLDNILYWKEYFARKATLDELHKQRRELQNK